MERLVLKVLADGQKSILLALVILTLFSMFLPPSVVKNLNDKVVAHFYEMMPRKPIDLTGAVVDLRPDMMGRPKQPYARSVPVEAPAADLPDLEVVFDELLKRSKTEDWDSVSFFLLFFFQIKSHKLNA